MWGAKTLEYSNFLGGESLRNNVGGIGITCLDLSFLRYYSKKYIILILRAPVEAKKIQLKETQNILGTG